MNSPEPANEAKSDESSAPAWKWRAEHLLWLPALVSLLIYLPTLNHGVITDDRSLIVENPYLVGLSGLRELWTDDLWEASAIHLPAHYYRPLVMTTFWIQIGLLGSKLWWLRLGNVLIHAATAALLPRLLLRTNPKLGIPLASLLTLLWALHPLNSESIVWLSGRFDGLVVLLSVVALFLNEHARRLVLVPTLFALALLTKEVGIALFPAIVLADIVRLGGVRASAKSEGYKWLTLLIVFGFYLALRRALGIYGASDLLLGIAPSVFLSGLADLSMTYARLTFVPLDLDVHHWYTARSLPLGVAVLVVHVAVFAIALVVSWKRKNGALIAGCLLGCLSLMLASNVGPSQHVYGDRFWSLPGIALVLALGEVLEKRMPIARIRLLPVMAATAVFGLLTLLRGTDWESEERLAVVALEREPDHPHWLLLSSHHLLRRGLVDEARSRVAHLLEIEPNMAKAHNAKCVVELRSRRLEDAERECLRATQLSPDTASMWINLASVYVNAKRYEDTQKAAEKALSIQPKNAEAEYLLAIVHANLGAFDKALQHAGRGLQIAPNHPALRKLKTQIESRTSPQ